MVRLYNVLCLEDSAFDAELIKRELGKVISSFEFQVVSTRADYLAALHSRNFDIILCDHTLPGFGSSEAIQMLRDSGKKVPLILVTGTMTENLAREIVYQGAEDYVLKDQLQRLPYSVINAIEKYRHHQDQHQAVLYARVGLMTAETTHKSKQQIAENRLAAQKKITRSRIRDQEKEKQRIRATLQEDINQQLCAIQLWLDSASKQMNTPIDALQQSRGLLQTSIETIRSMCVELVPPAFKQVPLTASIREFLESSLVKDHCTADYDLEKSIDECGEEMQLSIFRIVQEQVANIINYAEATHIRVSISTANLQLRIQIQDNGCGFTMDSRRGGEVLNNLKSRVELFDGELKLTSYNGEGCTLDISIPLAVRSGRSINKLRIVMAENDVFDRRMVEQAIEEVGEEHSINFVENGKDLIDLLNALPEELLPSLIVVDNEMPVMNGINALKELDTVERLSKIPKVLYSSVGSKRLEEEARSANAAAFIKKGLTIQEMKSNVRQMLSYCHVAHQESKA